MQCHRWLAISGQPCLIAIFCNCREKALGLNDPQVAESLCHVGQLLQRLGRCSEAEPMLRRAVKIEIDQFGKSHLQACASSKWRLIFYLEILNLIMN